MCGTAGLSHGEQTTCTGLVITIGISYTLNRAVDKLDQINQCNASLAAMICGAATSEHVSCATTLAQKTHGS